MRLSAIHHTTTVVVGKRNKWKMHERKHRQVNGTPLVAVPVNAAASAFLLNPGRCIHTVHGFISRSRGCLRPKRARGKIKNMVHLATGYSTSSWYQWTNEGFAWRASCIKPQQQYVLFGQSMIGGILGHWARTVYVYVSRSRPVLGAALLISRFPWVLGSLSYPSCGDMGCDTTDDRCQIKN